MLALLWLVVVWGLVMATIYYFRNGKPRNGKPKD